MHVRMRQANNMEIRPHVGKCQLDFITISLTDAVTNGLIYRTYPIPGLHVSSDCSQQPDGRKDH